MADFATYFYNNWEERVLPLLDDSLSQAKRAGDISLQGRLLMWLAQYRLDLDLFHQACSTLEKAGERNLLITTKVYLARNLRGEASVDEAGAMFE